MKKYGSLLLLVLLFSSNAIFAQNGGFRLLEGSCKKVIESLRETQSNDSIAIEVFKKDYKIDKISDTAPLLNRDYTEIIKYFCSDKSKTYYCRLRHLNSDKTLLIN